MRLQKQDKPQTKPSLSAISSGDVVGFLRTHEKLLFVLGSGVGWAIDFCAFSVLVHVFSTSAFVANYVSSIAGSTFAFSIYCIYSAASGRPPRPAQIAVYVGYQFLSISAYSLFVDLVAGLPALSAWAFGAVAAKIIITPFNFVTNYLSTRTVLWFMRPHGPGGGGEPSK